MVDRAGLRLDTIERAIADIARGKAVVVVDDEGRENEGDIVFAAGDATASLLAFTIRYTSGVICVPMEGTALDRLAIPLMTAQNRERLRTAYTVSVDAADGISTGISAADRARTIQVLADADSTAADVTQPGHVFPLRYREGGVLVRRGHTEGAVDLARLAGRSPAAVIAEVVNDDGSMKRGGDLREFADEHGLALVSIAGLARYRNRHEQQLVKIVQTPLSTDHGTFQAHGYRHLVDGSEQVALVYGDIADGRDVLVRVHSECLTGDVFGSRRCDCGSQLRAGLAAIRDEGRGVVVYLRGHEGRGIGLVKKLQAYALQDDGSDTVDANLALGLPADGRDYATGAQILRELGVSSVKLLTNNPAKRLALETYGVKVTKRVAVPVSPHDENSHYLATKRDRMGHDLDHLIFESRTATTVPARTDAGPLP